MTDVRDDIRRFLAEDLGSDGDVTSRALLEGARVEADVVAKSACVLAGLEEAALVLAQVGALVEPHARDGSRVDAGTVVATARGSAQAVLAGERLALNFLMHMSGIATLARRLQDRVSAINPACVVAATRKTTPGFRYYEKRAVALGGAHPHRFGLFDAFLVKDNHRMLVPDVAQAVARCRALDASKTVEVEVETLEDALRAAGAGADVLLLDNRSPEEFASWAGTIRSRFPKALLEASGGITPDNVAAYAPYADRISLGYLTHSAPAMDFSLDVRPLPRA